MDTSDMTLSSLQKLLLDVVKEEKEMAGTSIPLNFAPNLDTRARTQDDHITLGNVICIEVLRLR